MSAHSKASLISEATTEMTSYDIPLQVQGQSRDPDGLYHQYYDNLPYLGTTAFVNDSITQHEASSATNLNPIFNHDLDDESSSAVSHGFFLGKESLQNLTVPTIEGVGCHDDDDDTEDEGIGEIYRSSHDPETWVSRRSDRSFKFKNSPEPTPRHALSPRIGNIGAIGQNIALGHRLGVLTEDASLIPKRVKLHASRFVIAEDSPVQTDVTWSKPVNASSFASLIYKIEVTVGDKDKPDDDDNVDWGDRGGDEESRWTQLGDVRWPVLRLYHVENKLFIGKVRVARRKSDILIKIRVRSNGELVLPDRKRHWTMSSYSEIAEVTFTGYDCSPAVKFAPEVQQTYL